MAKQPAQSPNGPRHLMIQVVAARNLDPANEVRRRVEFTLVTPDDEDGAKFGTNVTPWDAPQGSGDRQVVRWGKIGQKISFNLHKDNDPQAAIESFIEKAALKVQLMASKVPVQNSILREAMTVLPTSLMSSVTEELDEATAELEGVSMIPLRDLMAGTAKTISTGAWLRVRPPGTDARSGGPCAELWLQCFALPDHKEKITELRQSLERLIASLDQPNGFDIMASQQQQQQQQLQEQQQQQKLEEEKEKEKQAAAAREVSLIDMGPDDLINVYSVGSPVVAAQPPMPASASSTAPAPVAAVPAPAPVPAVPTVAAAPPATATVPPADMFIADFSNHGEAAPAPTTTQQASTSVQSSGPSDSLYAQSPAWLEKQLKYAVLAELNGSKNQAMVPRDVLLAQLHAQQPALCNHSEGSIPASQNGQAPSSQPPEPQQGQQKKEASMQGLEQQLLAGLSDSLRF